MYNLQISPVAYQDPWNISLADRINRLHRGHQRVAYFYENPDNSTFRYRVYNMIQTLHRCSEDISAAYFTLSEIRILEQNINQIDVLVICRSRYNDAINHLITKARNKGKRVIFDVDDLVFNPEYVHLVLDTLDQDLKHPDVWDFWFAYIGRIGNTIKLCDSAITTNKYLAEQIHTYTGKPVSIIPNYLNAEQLDISSKIFNQKKEFSFQRNSHIHLGYFSGTPSHNKDLTVASDALARLLKEHSNLILRVVGYIEVKGELQNLKDRIEIFPLQDFINLQRLIGEVEINLVPLQDNEFTNCKSELKYFEAGIVGTVTVASPLFTFKNSINHGENGFIANSYEWYEQLSNLVGSIETLSTIAINAEEDSRQRYAWYNQFQTIEKILFSG